MNSSVSDGYHFFCFHFQFMTKSRHFEWNSHCL